MKLSILFLAVLIVGCASNKPQEYVTVSVLTSTEFGEVFLPDERFSKMEKECEDSVYAQGAKINGEWLTDTKRISEYMEGNKEYTKQFQAFILAKFKGGKLPKFEDRGDYFDDATPIIHKINACKSNQGWRYETKKVPKSQSKKYGDQLIIKL